MKEQEEVVWDIFPKLAMQEIVNITWLRHIPDLPISLKQSLVNLRDLNTIFGYFDKVGIDISIYKQFENWRYDITGRNNEKFDDDMFISERKVCVTQALICAFNLREKQLRGFIPQTVEYKNNLVKISRFSKIDIFIDYEMSKNGLFVAYEKYGGTENKMRVIVENVERNFDDNFQAPISDGIKVTLQHYVEDLHTLTYEPYFFKL